MYKINFYVPPSHLEQVKEAMFKAGAGKVGDYTCCAWQMLGEGQFMPMAGSNPFLGTQNQIEKTPEYKVELVCTKEHIKAAINALCDAHPYEEPAYQIMTLEEI